MAKPSAFIMILHIIALPIAITGAVGLGWATTELSSPDSGIFFELMGCAALAASGLWCIIALLIHTLLRSRNRLVHPATFITVDIIVGLYAIIGGTFIILSPFSRISWITCDKGHWTSICDDSQGRSAVIWRFVAAAFCFLVA
ncbi:hypothetical protein AJ80_07826 [Polytolypa hystricis UAMH7299]|uniref:MARVEL domain-containing protein n=1 Tax=Polytolypa hystricis (strain UAMH7299) TaxID=1447883 RepID=A0A2B7XHA4_POLH7|nr:hypothetical protein AJ80_07826 [Polytolypa hystricis UAMH7299]